MMNMNGRQRFEVVLAGQTPDRVPVFPLLMDFAARRAGLNYRQYASDGDALADAQLKVQEMFDLDAITACSDAFRVAIDLGGQAVFPEDKPPHIAKPIITGAEDLARLGKPDPADSRTRMYDRGVAVERMARAVGSDCAVLGWVEMPFAEACADCGVSEFMMLLYEDPALAHRVLEFVTAIAIDFALYQVERGATMIGAGDAAASLISAEMYREFALPYEQRVCQAVHNKNAQVKLHICGDTTRILSDMVQSGADLFNVDHLVSFDKACDVYGSAQKAFKGKLDPVADILQADPQTCHQKAMTLIRAAKGKRYMLGAGCEIPAAVTDETFRAFCSAAVE